MQNERKDVTSFLEQNQPCLLLEVYQEQHAGQCVCCVLLKYMLRRKSQNKNG